MPDPVNEWFSITKAHLYFPCSASLATIRRWANSGVKHKTTGKLVMLRTKYVGGRRLTSMKCYQQFVQELNGDV